MHLEDIYILFELTILSLQNILVLQNQMVCISVVKRKINACLKYPILSRLDTDCKI